MHKGFVASRSKSGHIKSVFAQSDALCRGSSLLEEKIESQRSLWKQHYSGCNYDYSLDDLLLSQRLPLTVQTTTRDDLDERHLLIFCGLWMLVLTAPLSGGAFHDFQITVLAGGSFRFDPDVIQEDIIQRYGEVVYEQWRQMVRDDLSSLQAAVAEASKMIKKPIWSVTSARRSEHLCRQAGLSVHRGIAFLFPDSYV